MPTPQPALPVVLAERGAYHGDTLLLLAGVTVTWPSSVGSLGGAVLVCTVRDAHGRPLLALAPTQSAGGAGELIVDAVTIPAASWANVPRSAAVVDYDLQATHAGIGTATLVRGRLHVALDVSR